MQLIHVLDIFIIAVNGLGPKEPTRCNRGARCNQTRCKRDPPIVAIVQH